MLKRNKERAALKAMNAVLVIARKMAFERVDHQTLAGVLDVAELLPMLILEEEGRSETFREQLEGLAARFPEMELAVSRYDDEE